MRSWANLLGFLGGLLTLMAASLIMSMGSIGELLAVERSSTVTLLGLLIFPSGLLILTGGSLVWVHPRIAGALMLIGGAWTWGLVVPMSPVLDPIREEMGWVQILGNLLLASRVLDWSRWGLLLAGAVAVIGGLMALRLAKASSPLQIQQVAKPKSAGPKVLL